MPSPRSCEDTQLTLQDFDYYEIHEAFAAVPLCLFKAWESAEYCRERLRPDGALGSIDTSKLNVKGGSVAIGHPFAATGARILAVLAKVLADDPQAQARAGLGLHRRRHGRDRDPGARVSQYETLMARDGHAFNAYIAKPAGKPRGARGHRAGDLRAVARISAGWPMATPAEGYLAVAPALFDRVARGLVLGYSPPEIEQALGYRKQIPTAKAVLDIAAAAAMARHTGKVGGHRILLGRTLAWAAASEVPLAAAVCYYGGGIAEQLPKAPTCPTLLHFGEHDRSIPASDIERIRQAYPPAFIELYPAGHAFCNDDRPQNYNAAAAALARERTGAFLAAAYRLTAQGTMASATAAVLIGQHRHTGSANQRRGATGTCADSCPIRA